MELHARKARLIAQACARLGLEERVDVHVADATSAAALAELLAASHGAGALADAVVLDAPCSGTGTLRRNPEHRYREAEPRRLESLCQLQAQLLDAAAGCVTLGGSLTYSVCSPLACETTDAIAAFLQRPPGDGFEVIKVDAAELQPYTADCDSLGGARACLRRDQ